MYGNGGGMGGGRSGFDPYGGEGYGGYPPGGDGRGGQGGGGRFNPADGGPGGPGGGGDYYGGGYGGYPPGGDGRGGHGGGGRYPPADSGRGGRGGSDRFVPRGGGQGGWRGGRGGGPHEDGRGGGNKRPGGGSHGDRGPGKKPQANSADRGRMETDGLMVKTNLFPLTLSKRVEWNIHQFDVKIDNYRKKKPEEKPAVDVAKEVPVDVPGEAVAGSQIAPVGDRKRREINDKSSPLSRRILLKCQQVLRQEWLFVTDGTKIAYSTRSIPEKYDISKFSEEDKDQAGIVVEVKDGCDDHHLDAPHVTTRKYRVFFVPVADAPFKFVMQDGKVDPSCCENLPKVNNFMNLLLNNACMKSGLISTKKNPERYYFPVPASRTLLNENFQERNGSHPLLGLAQSVNLAVDGSMQIQSDFLLGWFESVVVEKPLLDPRASTLAGVHIADLHRPITNAMTQKAIQDALKPLLFNSRYKCGPQWEEKEKCFLREKHQGRDDLENFIQDQINKKRVAVQLNRRLVIPKDGKMECLEFRPSDFTFSFKDEVVTVEEYFLKRYDVILQYPHMPLVLIRKRDYMPCEFLFRAFDQQKNANHDSQKETALRMCDRHSGLDRISHIERLNEEDPLEPELRGLLRELQIDKGRECLQVHASVLKEPTVLTGKGKENIAKGSWFCNSLNRAARLNTLAVLDLKGSSNNSGDVLSLLRTCENQGIVCQQFRQDEIAEVTVSFRSAIGARVELKCLRKLAAQVRGKAYQFFLHGGYNRPIKTTVRCEGELRECVIVPLKERDKLTGNQVCNPVFCFDGLDKTNDRDKTHEIGGNPYNPSARYPARLCFSRSAQAGPFLDPFADFDQVSAAFHDLHIFYNLGHTAVPQPEAVSPSRLLPPGFSENHKDGMIDCPGIVIVRLRDKDAMQYSLVKYALYEAGLQSQCFVDGGRFQVLTKNLSIKINAKLSNPFHQSSSWTIKGTASEWLKNSNTLVIGYAFAGAQGKDGNMVVVASSCVDDDGLSMRHANIVLPKSPYLKPVAAEKLISTLYDTYVRERNQRPSHLVVYRCNGQDSELNEIRQQELDPIEKVFNEKSSADLPDLGIVSNPQVTFLVAQTLNKVKLAPNIGQPIRLDGRNVPSGTCVTDSRVISHVIDGSGMQSEGFRDHDFILVPQHGLKGTSKPVYYRVLKLGIVGSIQTIRDVTYSLSFRYATATKVPRLPAVLLYSQRIAGVVLACLPDLKNRGQLFETVQGYFSKKQDSTDHLVFGHIEGPTAFHPHLLA